MRRLKLPKDNIKLNGIVKMKPRSLTRYIHELFILVTKTKKEIKFSGKLYIGKFFINKGLNDKEDSF